MKKIQILTTIMIIAIFIFIPKNTKAYNENDQTSEKNEINTDIILEEQQSNFGIRDFLKEAENYSPDFVKDLDISNIFNSALTGKIDNSNILKKLVNNEESLNLYNKIITLPQSMKEALILYYYLEVPQQKIAQIMNISNGAVRTLIYRARKNLKMKMEE